MTALPDWTCTQGWALDAGRSGEVPEADSPEANRLADDPDALRDWVREHDAAALEEMNLDLALLGRTSRSVLLRDVQVRLVSKEPAGDALALPLGCGGPAALRSFSVPLDLLPLGRPVSLTEIYERWPSLAVPAPAAGHNITPLELPLMISEAEPEVLRISARANACDCRWELILTWAVAHEDPVRTVVRLQDRPFRTMADAV